MRKCKVRDPWVPIIVFMLMFMLPGNTLAGSVYIPGVAGDLNLKVVSYKEARFSKVVKQQYDFSCGSAALATLLTFHYEIPTTEQQVFDSMYAIGDKEKIAAQGFSLLDMKNYLATVGLDADGYTVSLSKLHQSAKVPAIALINTNGYNHFVVVKGLNDKEVLVADPAQGARVVNREKFERSWNGLLFLVKNRTQIGQLHYNEADDWKVRNKAPFGTALSAESGSILSLTLPRPMEY